MQQMFFIADLIACSTCFRHHYANHQELESIIQKVAVCGIWCFGFQVQAEGGVSGLRAASQQTGHTTLRSTPYQQLENQNTKYHRQQPSV
jgi:hypothetical protein